ncbi:MAG: hypothetical protein OEY43_08190 [Gammaproteobacteria bacterium]|nr:hypothetical protein [Gammaproteobacteria bacterium]
MCSYKKNFVFLLVSGLLVSSSAMALAEGVFLNKNHSAHELSQAEQKQLATEFQRKFGATQAQAQVKTNNPWKNKKQQQNSTKDVSWGECREYAIQTRNACYKAKQSAYNCERFYEARSKKCDSDY